MADVHTKEQRSYNMSRVKSRDTSLELEFRKKLFAKGARGYRVIVKLPGKPDIVFIKRRLAIFVDGCFWHKCPRCFYLPSSNKRFWKAKIDGNVFRDKRINKELKAKGYKVLRFWEHELKKDINKCVNKVITSLADLGSTRVNRG